jgi:hypothetical protein
MKRLAAVAVIVAWFGLTWFGLTAGAQRGTAHGGFSGSHGGSASHSAPGFHGGFSGSHGFSGPRTGLPIHSVPFHGGINSPGRFASPPRYGINRSPNQFRAIGPSNFSPRQPYTGSMRRNPNNVAGRQPSDPMHNHRMPYHSPYGRDHRRGFYAWGGFPLWSGWGYPYLLPSYLDYPDYDSGSNSNYASSQPAQDYSSGPYEPQPDPDQYQPESAPSYTPWPYGSPTPGASQSAAVPAPPVEAPVTLVFKDGRPAEQVHNYMLTSSTLTVLDQHRRDIPIDQLDLTATAKANRDAGVDFALPGRGR